MESRKHIIEKFRSFYQSILTLFKKIAIPFGVVSTALLTTTINQVKAQTIGGWLWERSDVKNSPFSKESLKQQSSLENIKESLEQWKHIGEEINNAIEWFNHLPENVLQMSIDLMAWIYGILAKFVLVTPTWLFNNAWFYDTTLTYSMISVVIVIVLTIFETMKMMFNTKKIKYTKFSDIIKRFPIAIAVSGFAPFLFEKTFEVLNQISHIITTIGVNEIQKDNATTFNASFLDLLAIVGFDIVLISLLFPILLKNGRRCFDLICLGVMTPLAMTAWIFDSFTHHFNRWWKTIKHLSLVQITYSVFICILGLFIFGTRNFIPTDPLSIGFKLMIIAGGLWRLANPPSFVTNAEVHGKNVWEIGKDLINILTFKNFTPLKFYNSELKPYFKKRK